MLPMDMAAAVCMWRPYSVSLSRLILVEGMGVVGTGRKWVCPRLSTCQDVETLLLREVCGNSWSGLNHAKTVGRWGWHHKATSP